MFDVLGNHPVKGWVGFVLDENHESSFFRIKSYDYAQFNRILLQTVHCRTTLIWAHTFLVSQRDKKFVSGTRGLHLQEANTPP